MLDDLRAGDVVTVTCLDRLARSRHDVLAIAVRIKQATAGLRSLAEPWADTTTPGGRSMLTVLAGILDFERGLIAERTSAVRTAARAQCVKCRRSSVLSDEHIAQAQKLIDQKNKPIAKVARFLSGHRSTLYRALDG
ncbi:DNA invertase Pin-like site-specific DNA recombinase [Aquamicrobium terrae]|uniref:DNA invertase Pin-like site-specific DNA recombinase n=2 Tax=Aquamicrobium terrae TaxID=1324945 RepID=A0ABV2N2Y3_9HYPH